MRLRHLRALPEIDTPSNRASRSEASTKADSKYPDLERGVDQCPNWADCVEELGLTLALMIWP
jgi:hypothetical protein